MSFVIVDLAIDLLRVDPSGDQRFVWAPEAAEALSKMLDVLLGFPREARSGIDDLLRLVCALELELASPRTAAQLRSILSAEPRVIALCDLENRSRELKAAQTRWSGASETKQAPLYGRRAPAGTITAASLLDPGTGAARRISPRRSQGGDRGRGSNPTDRRATAPRGRSPR